MSSRAMERPTAPAPAMATRMGCSVLLGALLDDLVGVGGVLLAEHHVQEVAFLDHGVPLGQHALAEPVDPRDPAPRLLLERHGAVTDPRLCRRHLVEPDRAG